MSINFVKAGLQTSIQDSGRYGQMHNGVSQSGAMDKVAMQMANWLVSKHPDSPLIEITMAGPTIRFTSKMSIGISGADFECQLNNKIIKNNQTIHVSSGDVLVFGKCRGGIRAYLAFSADIVCANDTIKPLMGSYSTHLTACFGGYKGRAFQDHDLLALENNTHTDTKVIPAQYRLSYSGSYLLRTVTSVETTDFNQRQRDTFYGQSYQIMNDSDRMGVRLTGSPVIFEQSMQITSTGLIQGSIQLPPDGQPIISAVDGQTLGGYPRIASVISADLPLLGQLKPKDRVRFSLIDTKQAMVIYKDKQDWLDTLFITEEQ